MPIATWLPRYESGLLRFDVRAGLTGVAVVISQAITYATIAGPSVRASLYTALDGHRTVSFWPGVWVGRQRAEHP